MSIQNFIFVSLFVSLFIGCRQKPKAESENIEVKEVVFYDIADDVPLPPKDLTSNFKTLQDWLFSVCDGKKPEKSIAKYNFGLFESPGDNILYLVGLNKYDQGDSSHIRIEFEPQNMFFKLQISEYKNLSWDQLLNKLTHQLKAFTNIEKFKSSFLSKANTIIFETNGQIIWSK